MSATVTGTPAGVRIDCKRLYLPGVTVTDVCPRCGKSVVVSLGEHYLSFPKSDEPTDLYFCCPECEEDMAVRLVVRLTVEAVPAK